MSLLGVGRGSARKGGVHGRGENKSSPVDDIGAVLVIALFYTGEIS